MEKIDLIATLNELNELIYLDQEYYNTFISSFSKDTIFQITIKKGEYLRSSQQNRYYWGVILNLALSAFKENGYNGISKEEIHKFFKSRFLWKENIDIFTGEIIKIIGTTSELSKKEFNEFIHNIEEFLLEQFNIDLSKTIKNNK
jgi:hypothetical protein